MSIITLYINKKILREITHTFCLLIIKKINKRKEEKG